MPLPGGETLEVVKGVDCEIEAGRTYAIVGKSGSGKTSLLSVLGLLNSGYTGDLTIEGRNAQSLNDAEKAAIRNRLLGFVFQSYSLIPHLNAAENVALPLRYSTNWTQRTVMARALESLTAVGLPARSKASPRHLSGGEQQRVAIARALANKPRIVLADEPTGALDEDTGASIIALLIDRVREENASLIIVTHDVEIANQCDVVLAMHAGVLEPVDGRLR